MDLLKVVKTGYTYLIARKTVLKITFVVTGVFSTIWFLSRIIQKPSRVTYPCMQVTAPVMSAFLVWLFSLLTAVFSFKKGSFFWRKSKYPFAVAFFIAGLAAGTLFIGSNFVKSFASANADVPRVNSLTDPRNEPVGNGYGIYNGRVVWVYDADATNENCTNTSGDFWFEDKNTDQAVVDRMLDDGIKKIAGEESVADAWESLFTYHNKKKGRSNKGYTAGEKICIKINLTNSSYLEFNSNDKMDATPQLVLSLLKQLVNEVGIAEEDITLGDPFRTFRDIYWDKCHTVFPDVNYIDNKGEKGRQLTEVTSTKEFFTSDGNFSSVIPKAYKEASYFINMSCLKSHDAAGISMGAKNHQGSVLGTGQTPKHQQMGKDLHYCFPSNDGYYEMGNYRHLVDYMGNQYMGGNTVLYFVDAIWTGHNWNGVVYPWEIEPFNGDFMSSLFISQDPVAIESVGFDFLFEEYLNHSDLRDGGDYPLYIATQDYLHQAADPENWPAGITYDPEDDGTALESLGVHEHWDGVSNKRYSGNLGEEGGIHLVSVPASLVQGSDNEFEKDTTSISTSIETVDHLMEGVDIFPNPISDQVNIRFQLQENAMVRISLFSLNGQEVLVLDNKYVDKGIFQETYNIGNEKLGSGAFICSFHYISGNKDFRISRKIQVVN